MEGGAGQEGFLPPKICNESRFGTRKLLGQPGRSAFGSDSVAVQSPWCGLPCSIRRLYAQNSLLVRFRGLRILRKPRSDLGSGVLRSARGVRRDAAYSGARGMIRLLSYFFHHPFHSEPRTPGVVASFCLSFDVLAGRFLCHVANATCRILFQGLELWQSPRWVSVIVFASFS
jgi:hypothetical protein